MTTEIFSKNLALLKSLHPNAYQAVRNSKPTQDYEITLSNSGLPTLSYLKPNKSKVYLLSKYDPIREASRLIDSFDVRDCSNFIVLGIGLGYQIGELINSIPKTSKIIVIELDKSLARLSFETIDHSSVLKHPGLTLNLPNDVKEISSCLESERINFSINNYRIIQQNSLSEVNSKEYKGLLTELSNYFQASMVELKTLSAKSKTFSNNIYNNYQNLIASPGINVLKGSFPNIPAIICSAGPSLDKNIQLLKTKRENFLLISAATALKPLLKNKICPDFVVAIDPDEVTIQFFDHQSDLLNTWLVYDPVIPDVIPKIFTDRRLAYDSSINLAQWLQKHLGRKGSLGKVFSVAHAAYKFAKLIGCTPIIFIGQDLSFTKKRLHSRNTYYYQYKEDLINRLVTMEYLDDLKFQSYSNNLLERKSIFNSDLFTTVSLDTYAQIFSDTIDDFSKTFNATEGGTGIDETKNILLREAINSHCLKNISKEKNIILNSIQLKPFQVEGISGPAGKQFDFFRKMDDHLNRLENKFLRDTILTDQIMEDFVKEMKSTIQNLLDNEEATLLLQGYDFSGFSRWNKKSNYIVGREISANSKDLVKEEFQRDQEFFMVLKKSVKFNMNVFEDFTK